MTRHKPCPGIAPAILSLLLMASISAARAEMPFFDFSGYSYLAGPAWQPGTGTTVVARFNSIQPNPVWPVDTSTNEYTVLAADLLISSVFEYAGIVEVSYSGGALGLYRDSARNSLYAPGPPNAEVPGTFGDGVPELVGHFTELTLMFDRTTGVGTVAGFVEWTGGEKYSLLADPNHWTFFGGVSDHDGLGTPPGYDLAWDPQVYGQETPVPIRSGSWGELKLSYRR